MKVPRTVALVVVPSSPAPQAAPGQWSSTTGAAPGVLALLDDGTIWQASYDAARRSIVGWSAVPSPGWRKVPG